MFIFSIFSQIMFPTKTIIKHLRNPPVNDDILFDI